MAGCGTALVTVRASDIRVGAALRRFLAVITIAVVVLAITAGPAFASVCAGSMCGTVMVCAPVTTDACPMESGSPMMHTLCTHQADHGSRDVVAVPSAPDSTLAVVPLVGAVIFPATPLGAGTFPLADARGAPHLTTVIRI
jgi:hypothetical protein